MAQKSNNESNNGTRTEIVDATDASDTNPTLQLRLAQPRDGRRVVFHEGIIDNEHLNRKKSKCCCIYKKPLAFGESSSEDDEDCEHCFGHPEKRKKNRKHNHEHDHGDGQDSSPHLSLPDVPSTSAQAADPKPPPPAEPVEEKPAKQSGDS